MKNGIRLSQKFRKEQQIDSKKEVARLVKVVIARDAEIYRLRARLDAQPRFYVCFDCRNGNPEQFKRSKDGEVLCKLCGSDNAGEPDWKAG